MPMMATVAPEAVATSVVGKGSGALMVKKAVFDVSVFLVSSVA